MHIEVRVNGIVAYSGDDRWEVILNKLANTANQVISEMAKDNVDLANYAFKVWHKLLPEISTSIFTPRIFKMDEIKSIDSERIEMILQEQTITESESDLSIELVVALVSVRRDIEVDGTHHWKGYVREALFTDVKTYPMDPESAFSELIPKAFAICRGVLKAQHISQRGVVTNISVVGTIYQLSRYTEIRWGRDIADSLFRNHRYWVPNNGRRLTERYDGGEELKLLVNPTVTDILPELVAGCRADMTAYGCEYVEACTTVAAGEDLHVLVQDFCNANPRRKQSLYADLCCPSTYDQLHITGSHQGEFYEITNFVTTTPEGL